MIKLSSSSKLKVKINLCVLCAFAVNNKQLNRPEVSGQAACRKERKGLFFTLSFELKFNFSSVKLCGLNYPN
jgi:hypothetical protein